MEEALTSQFRVSKINNSKIPNSPPPLPKSFSLPAIEVKEVISIQQMVREAHVLEASDI
ncbi:MAG: type IV pili twitching motility protein PilT, partial [Calothrix sp. SM1_7_51]|nr:type IV pili twitching motility protein PilT [Calothrix sp. SM1_7_51]